MCVNSAADLWNNCFFGRLLLSSAKITEQNKVQDGDLNWTQHNRMCAALVYLQGGKTIDQTQHKFFTKLVLNSDAFLCIQNECLLND